MVMKSESFQGPTPACFKAYDIRGRVPEELDEKLAWRIGNAFAAQRGARSVVLCRDIRLSSESIATAVAEGLTAAGCEVLDIGLGGTENVYFAVPHLHADGGIMVTASHNPADYNGMKLVGAGSVPLDGDEELPELARRVVGAQVHRGPKRAEWRSVDCHAEYVRHLLSYIEDAEPLRPLRIVVNAGNGGAGPVVDALAEHLPLRFVCLHHKPDGTFPNGVPNPLLPENREVTAHAVRETGADLGVAWDGDFDRCFFFDHEGGFVEGYYLVGLLAQAFLDGAPEQQRIVHDPRLTWNTRDVVRAHGGEPVLSRTGHAFIKRRMREVDAIYGGEMSGHHYFRRFAYCDSGMIPWLLVAAMISSLRVELKELVAERQALFPVSGEINRRIADPSGALAAIEAHYAPEAQDVQHLDGLSMEFSDWRFNLRASNTEPLVRLNVESRGDAPLMQARTEELLARLAPWAA